MKKYKFIITFEDGIKEISNKEYRSLEKAYDEGMKYILNKEMEESDKSEYYSNGNVDVIEK